MKAILCRTSLALAILLLAPPTLAELSRLGDEALSDISGQGGIYLSGDISINEMGGPVENSYFGRCDDADKKCGARFAYRLKENGGLIPGSGVMESSSTGMFWNWVCQTPSGSMTSNSRSPPVVQRGQPTRGFNRPTYSQWICEEKLSWKATCLCFLPVIRNGQEVDDYVGSGQ